MKILNSCNPTQQRHILRFRRHDGTESEHQREQMNRVSRVRDSRLALSSLALFAFTVCAMASFACEDREVADFNAEFRPVPTVERAPTFQAAPTVAAAPTAVQFEGFKQAPTVTQFEGFNEGNPCETYLENPTPQNSEAAARWAADQLEGASNQFDPDDPTQITVACQAALNRNP